MKRKKRLLPSQREKATSEMIKFGLWQDKKQVNENMNALDRESLKRSALKAQLDFRRIVLEQTISDKKLIITEAQNLKALITQKNLLQICVKNWKKPMSLILKTRVTVI